jgi:chromosome segregation ATPase
MTRPATEPPVTPPTERARGGRVGIVVGLVVAVLAAGVAVQQRQVAAGWQDRAIALEEQRDDARGRAEAFQRQLDDIADALAASETDVAALEDRVRELADEKAQAEDVATTTTVERDTLVAVSTAVAGAVEDLDTCVVQLFGLLNDAVDAFNRQGAGETVDVEALNRERTAANETCNAARRDAAEAAARADRLLR